MTSPRYQSLEGEQVKLLASPDGGALVRVIAGDVDGHRGPGDTHTPIAFVHATVAPGARLRSTGQSRATGHGPRATGAARRAGVTAASHHPLP